MTVRYYRYMVMPMEERFMQYVEKTETCWNWTGLVQGSKTEYGYFWKGPLPDRKKHPAHRVSHELFKGPIPEGFQVDHLCRNILCVNPDHLEAVTEDENKRRARLTVCRAGLHDLTDPSNVRFDELGRRRGCRKCLNIRQNRYYYEGKSK